MSGTPMAKRAAAFAQSVAYDDLETRLARLSGRSQRMVRLALEGRRMGEIASELGVCPSRTTQLMQRTLARLRDSIADSPRCDDEARRVTGRNEAARVAKKRAGAEP